MVVVIGYYSGVKLALNTRERLGRLYGNVEVMIVHRGEEEIQYAIEHNRKTEVDYLGALGLEIWTGLSVIAVKAIEDGGSGLPKLSLDFIN